MTHIGTSHPWWHRGAVAAMIAGAAVASSILGAPLAQAHSGHAMTCSSHLTTGQQTITMTVDGVVRTVVLYVPASALKAADRGGAPVLIALHGSNNPGTIMLDIALLAQDADQRGDIVVVPQGSIAGSSAGTWSWNVPGVTAAPAGTPDDVHFLQVLTDKVVRDYCGKRTEVFATGWSGGGRMISAVACVKPGLFAAIAPVVGLRAGVPVQDAAGNWVPDKATCSPHRGTPVVTFTGTADPINPASGGGAAYWQYSAAQALDRWLQIDGCRWSYSKTQGLVTTTVGVKCRQPVVSYLVEGMGHTWPGGNAAVLVPAESVLGPYSDAINANDAMWRFFRMVS